MKKDNVANLDDSKLEKVTGGGVCGNNDNGMENNNYGGSGYENGSTSVGGICGDTSGGIVGAYGSCNTETNIGYEHEKSGSSN